ncbi:MAG: hypothetical protein AB2L14_23455 [Candidatus Xenobiia bacterium LiM19]
MHSRFYNRELDEGFLQSNTGEMQPLEFLKFRGDAVESLMTSLDRRLHPVRVSVKYPGRRG